MIKLEPLFQTFAKLSSGSYTRALCIVMYSGVPKCFPARAELGMCPTFVSLSCENEMIVKLNSFGSDFTQVLRLVRLVGVSRWNMYTVQQGSWTFIGSASQSSLVSYANKHAFLGADVKLTRATTRCMILDCLSSANSKLSISWGIPYNAIPDLWPETTSKTGHYIHAFTKSWCARPPLSRRYTDDFWTLR